MKKILLHIALLMPVLSAGLLISPAVTSAACMVPGMVSSGSGCVFGSATTQTQSNQTTITPTVTPNTSGKTCVDPTGQNEQVYYPDSTTGQCPSYASQAKYNGVNTTQTNGNLPNYVALEPIPGLNQTGSAQFGQLLSQLFKVLLIIGALIAVGAFVYAGIMYMVRDSVSGVEDAKKRLTSALWGLLLLIGAWVILYTINPQLITFNGSFSAQTGNYFTNPQQAQLTPIQQDIANCTNSGGTPTYTTAPSGSGFTTCDDQTFMQKYFSFTDCRAMSSGGVCLVGRGTVINKGYQNSATNPIPQ